MSNLYVTEPATNGKVILDTTAGEIEVELWGKEAPKAVRNFLALTMEGYYDGVIFHRIVPGFIIQSGDPTGTGMGGESFYGEPFEDEVHPRLKFNRRGLLGMANNGKRHTNTSQFFFTLDKADELTNKHTLFGKIVGNTIYNVVDLGNLDIDAEERPVVPPKIKGIRIIENPFDDIVPRITAAERKAQQKARLEAKKEMEFREKRARAKKNTGLLSFGDSEEIPATEIKVKKKGMTRQDLMEPEEATLAKPVQSLVDVPDSLKDIGSSSKQEKDKQQDKKAAVDLKDIRAQHEREKAGSSAARQADIKRMEEDLRRLKNRRGNASDSDSDSDWGSKRRKGPSVLEQELAKYSKGRGRAAAKHGNKRGRRDEEDDLLKEMSRFSSKVARAEQEDDDDDDDEDEDKAQRGDEGNLRSGGGEGEEDLEVDDDVGWLKHKLKFIVDEKELTRRAEEEYSVIDPRAKARQLADDNRKEKDGQRRGMRTAADVGRSRR
ncbi:hypothetical protein IAT40_004320 [Kwoniella sp. CBS 6097]